jgi:hypothetical protein
VQLLPTAGLHAQFRDRVRLCSCKEYDQLMSVHFASDAAKGFGSALRRKLPRTTDFLPLRWLQGSSSSLPCFYIRSICARSRSLSLLLIAEADAVVDAEVARGAVVPVCTSASAASRDTSLFRALLLQLSNLSRCSLAALLYSVFQPRSVRWCVPGDVVFKSWRAIARCHVFIYFFFYNNSL